MTVRLTIDTCCVNALGKLPGMNKLEEWWAGGLVTLCAAQRLLDETEKTDGPRSKAQHEKARRFKDISEPMVAGSVSIPDDRLGSRVGYSYATSINGNYPEYTDIQAVLFADKGPVLEKRDNFDVMHLLAHAHAENDIFVTINRKDFIKGGRREALMDRFGIRVMDPDETVNYLKTQQGWT